MEKLKTTRREFTKLLIGGAGLELSGFALPSSTHAVGQRVVVPLDGEWDIEDSVQADSIPGTFGHRVRVPGLAHSANPSFPDVDQYQFREYVLNMIRRGLYPPSEDTGVLGRTPQKRNYFWYRKSFHAPMKKQVAILKINKAQFGTAVWLNGKKIGEHLGCFTRGHFNVTEAMDWEGENHLLVRIGAHPGALPEWVPAGTDQEKPVWTPGIYDSVTLHLCDNPVIESVQAGPRIRTSSVVVQTELHNYGPATAVDLVHRIRTWKGAKPVGEPVTLRVQLAKGEKRTVTQTIPMPGAVLWSPENPFLYVAETSTAGDNVSTRFGMREFRFDNSTSRRALLNGKPYFMRGASITLHRFFGDPLSKYHPWEEAWVREFLGEIPKRMHWNSFRVCIGPAPEIWLDIADEVGLLLQYEYAVWTGSFTWRQDLWKTEELLEEYKEFVRDNWNHPSLAIWDASNETLFDVLREKVIPAVRGLDLSNRPWDNGYSVPQGPNDSYEDHPYLLSSYMSNDVSRHFQMTQLETMDGKKQSAAAPSGHAAIINEYDWLWLKRDGTPTILCKSVFDHFVGPDATPEQRFELAGYFLAGITEFWRAHRHYAAVMYLAYLDASLPNSFTCDNFRDPEKLELQPHFEEYMKEAFKPLGVYINFWHPQLVVGSKQRFRVMIVNDEYEGAKGRLVLAFSPASGGAEVVRGETALEIPSLGQMTYDFTLEAPTTPGDYLLSAKAYWRARPWSPTISRRKVSMVSAEK
jgi:beta-galactosidase